MKKIMLAAVLGALFNTASSIAHEGHDHSFITEYAAVDVGREFASGLTQKEAGFGLGKLPESWNKVSAEDAKFLRNGDGFYIVSVTNAKENKTLYVLMTSNGEVYDANFTGEFVSLKP
jgi:hypothetical protein